MDKESIYKRLELCLLTDEEFDQGPEAWKSHTDPIHSWEIIESEAEET